MRIGFTIRNQKLTHEFKRPVVSGTMRYIDASFRFTSEWEGLRKFVHFSKGDTVYDPIMLVDDKIEQSFGLNLTEGDWEVWIHGNRFEDGESVQRITTTKDVLHIEPTGICGDEPFPNMSQSLGEQIVAEIVAKADGVKELAEGISADATEVREAKEAVERLADEATGAFDALKEGIENGDFKGEKGDRGEQGPQGLPGIVVPTNGFFTTFISEDGDLILLCSDADNPPDLYISDGCLFYGGND